MSDVRTTTTESIPTTIVHSRTRTLYKGTHVANQNYFCGFQISYSRTKSVHDGDTWVHHLSTPAGCTWVHLGTPGYPWVHLGTRGYTRVHLGTPGYSTPGYTWVHLGAPGCTSVHLGTPGYTWVHLGAPGCTWVHLGTPGYTWVHLGTPNTRNVFSVVRASRMWCPHGIGRDSWVWGEQETL